MRIQARADLAATKTVVVKIGSALLATNADAGAPDVFTRVAQDIFRLKAQGKRIVLVSSGAIALGLDRLQLSARPRDLPLLQACAAAGQGALQRRWDEAFALHGVAVAQVLLTHGDLQNRRRFLNAQAALACLLDHDVIPIVNENDTVSVNEIRVGDNDTLAAEVGGLVGADVVVLLTSADGLRTKDPRTSPDSERIAVVDDIAKVEHVASGASALGTGGMRTKLDAARIARTHGAATVIAWGLRPDVLQNVFAGDDVGTLVTAATSAALPARKRWLSSTVRPLGTIVVDEGARRAVEMRGASLLAVGVLRVEGDFNAGDVVKLCEEGEAEGFAHGLAAVAGGDITRFAAKTREDQVRSSLVVHRDDLVLLDNGSQ